MQALDLFLHGGENANETTWHDAVSLVFLGREFSGLGRSEFHQRHFDQRYSDPDTSGGQQYVSGDFPREGFSAMLNIGYAF